MKIKTNNEDSWVSFPRKMRLDRLQGSLSPSEYDLNTWMRHGADPYGAIVVSLEGLVADFAHRSWGKNHINKLLLSLREKRYLHYESRSGRRGSFQVHFPDFRMPNGGISKLEKLEKVGFARGGVATHDAPHAEEAPEHPFSNQSFVSQKESISKLVETFSMNKGRGSKNDTETKNETEKNRCFERKIPKDILVTEFHPSSAEEQFCWELAHELGEEKMDFLLGTYYKHGLGIIQEADSEYRKISEKKKRAIENKASYFNGIVEQILAYSGKKLH